MSIDPETVINADFGLTIREVWGLISAAAFAEGLYTGVLEHDPETRRLCETCRPAKLPPAVSAAMKLETVLVRNRIEVVS